MQLQQVLLVTGGSRGIGAEIIKLAATRGYAVCINYANDQATAEKLLAEVTKIGVPAIAVQADVSQERDVEQLFQTIDSKLGRISALVNNVGKVALATTITEMSAARIQSMLNINVLSYFLCAKQAVLRMSTKHGGVGGAIVNISSVAARLGSPNTYIDYAASKGAIDTMTLGLAKEVANQGIRVNAVRPGYVHTDIHADSGDADRLTKIEHTLPMQRAGQPIEIANAALWLLSSEASYVTGSILDVAGGR